MGHVLGAAMFQIKVGSESVVYTVMETWGTGRAAWLEEREESPPSSPQPLCQGTTT